MRLTKIQKKQPIIRPILAIHTIKHCTERADFGLPLSYVKDIGGKVKGI
nr:MAG TPA: hypothetical protein [Caudoviricetes sp.]